MVFENLTLFEFHVEDARIGPSIGRDDDESGPAGADTGGGGRRGLAVGALVLLALAAVVARRRFRDGGGDGDGDDGEQITIEHAAEQ